jgi:hypothetical protein
MMRSAWIIVIISVLSALSVGLSVVSVGEADGYDSGPIVVTIRLDQKEQRAQVSPGQTGIVTFTGEVKAEIADFRVQYLIVYLSYYAGTDTEQWPSTGTSQLIFSNGITSQQFSCEVKVPIGTSHLTSGSITVTGYWMNSTGSGAGPLIPDSSLIYIDQYYLTSLEVEERSKKVKRNEYAEFKLTLMNNGNGQDKYRLDIVADEGVIVVHDLPNGMVLAEGGSANFTVKARSDEEGSKKIYVRMFETCCGDNPDINVTLEIQVKYTIVDKISSIIDRVRDDLTLIFLVLSLIGAVGLGALLIMGLRTKGFSKQYP